MSTKRDYALERRARYVFNQALKETRRRQAMRGEITPLQEGLNYIIGTVILIALMFVTGALP